jgi:hypothetical protein
MLRRARHARISSSKSSYLSRRSDPLRRARTCRPTEDAEASRYLCCAVFSYTWIHGSARYIPRSVKHVRDNRSAHAHERLAQHPVAVAFQRAIRIDRTRLFVVRKDVARPTEHAVFRRYALVSRHAVLNLDIVTDANIRVSGHALAQMRLRPMTAPFHTWQCGRITAPSSAAALGETCLVGRAK